MKSTGNIRRIDELGRIVIPKEIRQSMMINEGDLLELFVQGSDIIFRKVTPGCAFCGIASEGLKTVRDDKLICHDCAKAVSRQKF